MNSYKRKWIGSVNNSSNEEIHISFLFSFSFLSSQTIIIDVELSNSIRIEKRLYVKGFE